MRDPEQRREAIVRKLAETSGRGLDEWIALVNASGLEKRKERAEWLKREHGLGHSQASIVVEYARRAAEGPAPSGADQIELQYAGDKAALRPLYERARDAILGLGSDVALEPRRPYVAFGRGRQFAMLQPSTKTRLDLGLALPGVPATDRLRPAGSFGSERISHRVALSKAEDLDDEVRGWMKRAYELAA